MPGLLPMPSSSLAHRQIPGRIASLFAGLIKVSGLCACTLVFHPLVVFCLTQHVHPALAVGGRGHTPPQLRGVMRRTKTVRWEPLL